jgi:uroporphyrinogen-III synthase
METVVVTASPGAFPRLAEALAEAPVQILERPLLSFEPPVDWTPLDSALLQRGKYGSVALTSPRAAAALAGRVHALAISWAEGDSPRAWAVGARTAEALQGIPGLLTSVAEPSTKPGAEALARVMLAAGASGPVLFLCGERRRDELPTILRENGLVVDEVVCYRTMLASAEKARAAASTATMLVVASPAVLELLVQVCPPSVRPALVAIGPTTAAAAQAAGWHPAAVASAPSTASLASAITGLLAPR